MREGGLEGLESKHRIDIEMTLQKQLSGKQLHVYKEAFEYQFVGQGKKQRLLSGTYM